MRTRRTLDRRSPAERLSGRCYRSTRDSIVCSSLKSMQVGFIQFVGGIVFMASCAGCAKSGPERIIVSGKVTYDGNPVSEGTILFTPLAASRVPSAGASIVDGKYEVNIRGGVPVGTHRISIEAYHNVPYTLRPGEDAPRNYYNGKVREQFLPSKYNANSQLAVTIDSGSGAIAKDFDLTD